MICFGRADNDNQTKIALRAASGAILARLLIMNTNYLAQLSSEPSLNLALQQEGLNTTQNILLCLVDFWLDKVCFLKLSRPLDSSMLHVIDFFLMKINFINDNEFWT